MTPDDSPARGLPSRPTQREDVVFRELGGEWVIFDPVTQRVHVLNLPAALVWSFCDGTRDEAALARELGDAFEVSPSPDEVREHVRASLTQLHDEGLLA